MSYPTEKAERIVQAIIDEMALMSAGTTIVKSYEANGTGVTDIGLTITGTGLTTSYVLIKAVNAPASGTADGLGLTQRVYTPHLIRFGYDSSAAMENAAAFTLLAIMLKQGVQVDLHADAAIAMADLLDASLAHFVVSYEPLKYQGWAYAGQ